MVGTVKQENVSPHGTWTSSLTPQIVRLAGSTLCPNLDLKVPRTGVRTNLLVEMVVLDCATFSKDARVSVSKFRRNLLLIQRSTRKPSRGVGIDPRNPLTKWGWDPSLRDRGHPPCPRYCVRGTEGSGLGNPKELGSQ